MDEQLLRRALAVYHDIADNVNTMPLSDCDVIRKQALERIEHLRKALLRKELRGG